MYVRMYITRYLIYISVYVPTYVGVSRKCDPDEIKLRKLYQKSGIYFPVRKQLYGSKHSLLNCYNFEGTFE